MRSKKLSTFDTCKHIATGLGVKKQVLNERVNPMHERSSLFDFVYLADNTQSADATTKPSVGKRGKISSWVKSKLHGKTSKHCQNHDSLTSITERKESEVLSEVLQGKTCPEGDHHPESNSNQMVCMFLSVFFGSK